MPATNSFLNGFLGGMQAVNSMIDSQARREYYKVQQQRAEKAFQWRQQAEDKKAKMERVAQQNQALQSFQYIRQKARNDKNPDMLQAYNEGLADIINKHYGEVLDNNNPDEYARITNIKPSDKNADQFELTLGVYDKSSHKLLRQGALTDGREGGGRKMVISGKDLVNGFLNDPRLLNDHQRLNAQMIFAGGDVQTEATVGGVRGLRRYSGGKSTFTPFSGTGLRAGKSTGSGTGKTKGTSLGSKLFSSWTTTDKKGDEVEHQLYKVGDQYVQLSFNNKTGQMKEANVAVNKVQSLMSQFGGHVEPGATPTPEAPQTTVEPKNKTPVVAENPGVVNSPPPADNPYAHYKNMANSYAPKIGRGIRDAYKQYQASAPARKANKDRMQQAWSEFRPGFNLTPPTTTAAPPPAAPAQPQSQFTDLDGIAQKARQLSATGDEAGLRDYLGQQDPKAVRKITQQYLRGLN